MPTPTTKTSTLPLEQGFTNELEVCSFSGFDPQEHPATWSIKNIALDYMDDFIKYEDIVSISEPHILITIYHSLTTWG